MKACLYEPQVNGICAEAAPPVLPTRHTGRATKPRSKRRCSSPMVHSPGRSRVCRALRRSARSRAAGRLHSTRARCSSSARFASPSRPSRANLNATIASTAATAPQSLRRFRSAWRLEQGRVTKGRTTPSSRARRESMARFCDFGCLWVAAQPPPGLNSQLLAASADQGVPVELRQDSRAAVPPEAGVFAPTVRKRRGGGRHRPGSTIRLRFRSGGSRDGEPGRAAS
jgi:hypothetical protein